MELFAEFVVYFVGVGGCWVGVSGCARSLARWVAFLFFGVLVDVWGYLVVEFCGDGLLEHFLVCQYVFSWSCSLM